MHIKIASDFDEWKHIIHTLSCLAFTVKFSLSCIKCIDCMFVMQCRGADCLHPPPPPPWAHERDVFPKPSMSTNVCKRVLASWTLVAKCHKFEDGYLFICGQAPCASSRTCVVKCMRQGDSVSQAVSDMHQDVLSRSRASGTGWYFECTGKDCKCSMPPPPFTVMGWWFYT